MNAHAVTSHPATVSQMFEIIHRQAAYAFRGVDRPRSLQLVRIHPLDEGKAVAQRFKIGDVDGMTEAALQDAANGHNVYIEGRTVANTVKGRGKAEDTVGVFAVVIDSDADKGKAAQLHFVPSLKVETSPGTAHDWLFLDQAILFEEASIIGDAIRAATGADSDTGVCTQPYRVAGTPNYPGPRKQQRGRIVTPRSCNTQAPAGPSTSYERVLSQSPVCE
jgi:hypothetical protein